MKRSYFIAIFLFLLFLAAVSMLKFPRPINQNIILTPSPISSPSPTPSPTPLPMSKILPTNYHVFQTFNNCGPAALSMTLSHYGISVSQKELGDDLRPYQVANGDNDDKSVTLSELAEKSKEYDFTPYHRPAGNIEIIKKFIALDIPVIARTWTKVNEDIGHYRVVKGYDDLTSELIQDDSLQGKNLRYSYDSFNKLWEKFNYEYLVLVPREKISAARNILGPHFDEQTAWKDAVRLANEQLSLDPDNITFRFNLSVALYHIGKYQQAVEEFEKVENQMPFRTLWYQIEPIEAYFKLGNYERVFSITDKILNNHNRAFSEFYLVRGEIYLLQNNQQKAKEEFEKALFYNTNLKAAQEALNKLN